MATFLRSLPCGREGCHIIWTLFGFANDDRDCFENSMADFAARAGCVAYYWRVGDCRWRTKSFAACAGRTCAGEEGIGRRAWCEAAGGRGAISCACGCGAG